MSTAPPRLPRSTASPAHGTAARTGHIWVTVSNDLLNDARRDLDDIGACGIKLRALTQMNYDPIDKTLGKHGILFVTYRALVGEKKGADEDDPLTRLQQIKEWFGAAGEGCILFDEAHKAKNLATSKPSRTAKNVERLQQDLPNARIVYASATGASEVKHMAYMTRLGLWGAGTPWVDFRQLRSFLESKGTGAMELLATELKTRGAYLARSLSFAGVSFDTVSPAVKDDDCRIYDRCADYWLFLLQTLEKGVALAGLPAKDGSHLLSQYWAAHQRFWQQFLLCLKVDAVVDLTRKSLAAGKCVVIGMQSTGEAGLQEWLDGQDQLEIIGEGGRRLRQLPSLCDKMLSCFLAKCKELLILQPDELSHRGSESMLQAAQDDHSDSDDDEDDSGESDSDDDDEEEAGTQTQRAGAAEHAPVPALDPEASRQLREMFRALDSAAKDLAQDLPPNAIDAIIDRLGGPTRVAELSGRNGRMERGADNFFRFHKRAANVDGEKRVNIAETRAFQGDIKHVAVLTDACSTGISLQADKRVANQRQRVHITVQLPWAPEALIQQLGRTHRSNQIAAPHYQLLSLPIGGEARLSASIACKLEQLGALTKGDAKAGTVPGSEFGSNFRNLGKAALEKMLSLGSSSAASLQRQHILPDCVATSVNRDAELDAFEQRLVHAFSKMRLRQGSQLTVDRFLNRIIGLRVDEQAEVFAHFTKVHQALLLGEARAGKKNSIVDLAGNCVVTERKKDLGGGLSVVVVERDRGVPWEQVTEKLAGHPTCKLWIGLKAWQGAKRLIVTEDLGGATLVVYRPGTGKVAGGMTQLEVEEKYTQIKQWQRWQEQWEEQHSIAATQCSHGGSCAAGPSCMVGRRVQEVHILTGRVLSAWAKVERLQKVVRVANGGRHVIGLQLPADRLKRESMIVALTDPTCVATSDGTARMESQLRKHELDRQTATLTARLVERLTANGQHGRPASVVSTICTQLSPPIVAGMNERAAEATSLLPFLQFVEQSFSSLRNLRMNECGMTQAEMEKSLKPPEADDAEQVEDASTAEVKPVCSATVAAILSSKISESQRQQRIAQHKAATQAEDEDDDFADSKPTQSPGENESIPQAKRQKPGLKPSSLSVENRSRGRSAIAKRLDKAAQSQGQQKLPFAARKAKLPPTTQKAQAASADDGVSGRSGSPVKRPAEAGPPGRQTKRLRVSLVNGPRVLGEGDGHSNSVELQVGRNVIGFSNLREPVRLAGYTAMADTLMAQSQPEHEQVAHPQTHALIYLSADGQPVAFASGDCSASVVCCGADGTAAQLRALVPVMLGDGDTLELEDGES